MATVTEALRYAYAQTGKRYSTAGDRIRPHLSGYADCSGLIFGALHYGAGMPANIPATSWAQARWCRDSGTLIPIKQALDTAGALVFWGDNRGYDGYGPEGHVAFTVGDGVSLMEARGTRYGIGVWPVTGRNPVNAGLVPGLSYLSAPPPVWADEEEEMEWACQPACAGRDSGKVVRVNSTHIVAYGGLTLIENGTNRQSFSAYGVQMLDIPKGPIKVIGAQEVDPNVITVWGDAGNPWHYHVRTA